MSSTNTSSVNTMNASSTPAAKKVAKKPAASASPAASAAAPAAPAAAVAAAPAPAAAKTVAKKTSPAATAAAPAPVAAPVSVPTPVAAAADATAAPVAETSFADEVKTLQDQLTAIRDASAAALSALKRVTKRAEREFKDARKNRRRQRAEPADGAPKPVSNFSKPVPISDELSAFLGGGKNATMSRADVTRNINKYIDERKLRTKHDITPDAALCKLLGVTKETQLTIFNIQTHLKTHYPKPAAAAAPATKA